MGPARAILPALLLLLGLSPAAAADGGVWHIQVRGDLDSVRLARDFAAVVSEADRDRPALILVELEADRDRLDIVWMMGRAIRSAEAPVAVWLRDPRQREVGLGAALLGAAADSCWISPGLAVAAGAGSSLAELMPEDVDLERAERELRGAMWLALEERSADRRLAEALVCPRQDAWAIEEAGPGGWLLALGSQRPAGGQPIVKLDPLGEPQVRLDSAALLGLKLARAEAPTTGALLRRAGAPVAVSRHRTLRSGLEDAERSVRRAVLQLDEAL